MMIGAAEIQLTGFQNKRDVSGCDPPLQPPRSETQTRTDTCSSERADVGGGGAAVDGVAAGVGVIALSSLPGQLWVLTPRLRAPARSGA